MSDSAALNNSTENFDNMTTAEFEARLPDLIASGSGSLVEDPRYDIFFDKNPDCAALVRDLEAIAKAAKDLFPAYEPEEELEEIGPGDKMWESIASKLKVGGGEPDGGAGAPA